MSEERVNHPAHYGGDTVYEVIKVIEAWELGFNLGNTVKYIGRAGKKDVSHAVTDLKKARFYLDREISNREGRAEAPAPIATGIAAGMIQAASVCRFCPKVATYILEGNRNACRDCAIASPHLITGRI